MAVSETGVQAATHAHTAGAAHALTAAQIKAAAAHHAAVLVAAHRAAVAKAAQIHAATPHVSIVERIQEWAYQWSSVVMIVFFLCLIFLMWRTLKVMPRVKPQQIKPASNQSVGWDDIAGVEEAKGELQEIVEFLRDPKQFKALGAKVPKGILLHGPPGTGKTLLAKAVAHESGAQFFAQSAASFVEMFAGLGAARIRRLFAIARKHEPAIIFIDELDAVGGRRGIGHLRGEGPDAQPAVGGDGWLLLQRAGGGDRGVEPAGEARPGAAAPGALRPPGVRGATRRGGSHGRAEGAHARQADGGVDLGLVAQQTSGLTGADLANICNEAAIFAARRGAQRIDGEDFDWRSSA